MQEELVMDGCGERRRDDDEMMATRKEVGGKNLWIEGSDGVRLDLSAVPCLRQPSIVKPSA